MKRTSIFCFSLAAITAGSFASCQDFDNGYDEDQIREAAAEKVYSENFKKYFGDYAVDHNWGFGAIPGGEVTTRANVDEKNLWEDLYHLSVPGWPDIYEMNGSLVIDDYHQATTQNKDAGWTKIKDYNAYVPAGDVTNEEIQYVSWWFRTHPRIESEIVHWSDFYVQEISADVDRYLTGENAGKANNALYEHKQEQGMWTDVNSGQTVEFSLSKLHVKALGNNSNPGNVSGTPMERIGYEHLEKYNGNTQNKLHSNETLYVGAENSNIYENIGTTDYRVCGFYTSSGTEDFACHNTNDDTWNTYWVIRHLHFTGPSGRVYDGWYLGFDYEFLKVDGTGQNYPKPSGNVQYQYHDRDYIYSNWILKLTPAMPVEYPKPSGFTRRVMCEDLGNTFDYDFNDVVFDVTYNLTQEQLDAYTNGDVDVTITIRAAGGTLPIYVGKSPSSTAFEAHNMLGSQGATNYPINVGNINNGKTGAIGVYHITVNSLDPDDIPIYVQTSGNIAGIAGDKGENNTHKVQEVKYTSLNQIAPQKFACPNTVQWMKELEFIDTGYPHFRDWAKAPNGTYAEYGSDGKTTSANAWFKVGVDAAHQEHIYEYQYVSEVVDPVLPPVSSETPFTVSSAEVAYATELEVGHSPLDLSTYIKSDLRSNTSAYSATITANDNDNTISLSGMVVSPQNAGTAKVTITYNDATYSNKTLVVPFIVKAATKVSPFKSTAPQTVTNLNTGYDFNLQNFVLDDALSGISITKVSGDEVLNLETKKVVAEGTEKIRLLYSGDSFIEESLEVTITVGGSFPPNGDAITFENPTENTSFIGDGKLTAGVTYDFEIEILGGYTCFSNGYSINLETPSHGVYNNGLWTFTAEVNDEFKISQISGSTIKSIKATPTTNNN